MAVITNAYESILVVSCKLGEEGIQSVIAKFKELIEANATLESVEEWGVRKLAYLIEKQSEGYYVLFNFTCGAEFPAELERVYKITDGVLRSNVIRKQA
ncbi:MAG: 30S ribosomal protein S6 [Ruminococcaceae bacterium]|nr:30S ribosomal protein S6 [Oscillospiraceae bacterium]